MARHPLVPPENRNPHDTDAHSRDSDSPKGKIGKQPKDPDKQGQQANTRQNTTHQGYQQDR
jgi:hypothetical protein